MDIKNNFDWESYFIASRRCYEVIRRHGEKVVIMEPVKGGVLAQIPEAAEKKLRSAQPEMSPAVWALRFAGSMEEVIAVLSGMSTLEQVKDNVKNLKDFVPLTEDDKNMLLAGGVTDIKQEFPCVACICDVIFAEVCPPDITVIHDNRRLAKDGFYCIQSRINSCRGGYGNLVSALVCVTPHFYGECGINRLASQDGVEDKVLPKYNIFRTKNGR